MTRLRRRMDIPHFAALRYRDYRYTWLANMCSGAAMWTFIVAATWLILDKSGKSGDVGILTFGSMLPFLLVSPFAGLIADRLDRQSIARFTFVANGLVTGIVAALAFLDAITLLQLTVLTFVSGAMRSTQEPAIASLIPNQVERKDLLNAVTLNAATRHGARFVGLLVASPLLAIDAIGVVGVLVLSVVFQAVGTVFMALTRTRSSGEASLVGLGVVRSFLEGLAYIYTDRMISVFILLVAFHCALVMSYDSVLPVFTSSALGALDGSILGYIVMSFGIGSLIGSALMAGVRSERNKGRWLLWTGVASGVAPIALAFSPDAASAIVVSGAVGAAQATFMALTTAYVQSIAPDRLRGRISSLYILHAGGIMAFANLGYGYAADVFSAPPVLYATAMAFLLFLLAANASLPDLKRVYRTGQAAAA